MIHHLKMSDPTVKAIINASFPDLGWTRVQAHIKDTVVFYGTMWDEGTKRDYMIVELKTMRAVPIEEAPFLRKSDFHEQPHKIPDGYVVVVASWRYKCDHFEIIAPPSVITPMITQAPELTYAEKVVLVATRSLKSSYAGISNYRFHANQGRITFLEWETAKKSLIEKKFLNKVGAITVDGRNACPTDYPERVPA